MQRKKNLQRGASTNIDKNSVLNIQSQENYIERISDGKHCSLDTPERVLYKKESRPEKIDCIPDMKSLNISTLDKEPSKPSVIGQSRELPNSNRNFDRSMVSMESYLKNPNYSHSMIHKSKRVNSRSPRKISLDSAKKRSTFKKKALNKD